MTVRPNGPGFIFEVWAEPPLIYNGLAQLTIIDSFKLNDNHGPICSTRCFGALR